MSNSIQFISLPSGASIAPSYGLTNTDFTISGQNLDDATGVLFVDKFQNEVASTFAAQSSSIITGKVPLVDHTLGTHEIRVQNEIGYSKLYFDPFTPVQTISPRRLIQHKVTTISDHLGINSQISDTAPNNTQGYQIAATTINAIHESSALIVSCELSLENDFWGAAVVGLFKDSESAPRRVWNYGLIGPQMGQMAVLSFVVEAGTTSNQTWRLRLGTSSNSFSTVYLNRSFTTANPYGLDIAKSYMTITEIEAEGASY